MVSSPLTPLPLKGLVNIFMVKIGKNFIPPTSSQDREYQQIFLAPTRSPRNTKLNSCPFSQIATQTANSHTIFANMAQTCPEQSIFIFLGQRALRQHSASTH